MPIYQIDGKSITRLERTTFAEQNLRERRDLQSLLKDHIGVISEDTLIVAEEFGDWEESRRRIDLLGVDKDANLVVFELKRTEDGGHMELQAIRYAAMIRRRAAADHGSGAMAARHAREVGEPSGRRRAGPALR